MFDEQPEDPHGECRLEIERLQALLTAVCKELGHLPRVRGDWAEDHVCPRCGDVEVHAGIEGEIVPPLEPGR